MIIYLWKMTGSTICALLFLVKIPSKDKKQQTCSLNKSVCSFGIPKNDISYRDTIFLCAFWTTLWEKMDTKFNISTTFHP
jgi:hypothetical protein